MQIEQSEINGFLIDSFNQHSLDVGKKQGTCPLCSHDRKPENKKSQCASYDWERGLGTCHNCNSSFQLHTYQCKGASDKEYTRPEPYVENLLKSKATEWFEARGISQKTLTDLRVGEGPEYMPQTGKQENTIQFNYIIGLSLIHI